MKVGYVQTAPVFGEKEKNFQEVRELLEGVKADLIVLPELFATGYTFVSKSEVESLAEGPDGETVNFLNSIAKETKALVVGGFVEREGNDIHNSSAMVSPDGLIDIYRKIHLFYKEKKWFAPGDKPLTVHEVHGTKVGMMICFDWFFPEVTRTLALRGADIIAHPANLVLPYCQKAMITRCIENRVFAVTANRIGTEKRGEDDFMFTGGSQITSTNGKILSSAPEDTRFVEFVDINVHDAREKHLNEFNDVLRDRRPNFYC